MILNRPYGDAFSREEALKEQEKYAGGQFDPGVVAFFAGCISS